MRKILVMAIMAMFMFACSDDETTALLQPVIETINLENVAVGDIITIPGKDFIENEIYSIRFNDIEGKVIDIKPTYLKVEVPKEATSGDITFTYKGESKVIGKIFLEFSTLYAFKSIYGISSDEESSLLVSIDPSDGTEKTLQTINDINTDISVFDKTTNRIYTVLGNESEDIKLMSYNLSDNTYSTVNLTSSNDNYYIYYELVVGKDGVLYASKNISEKNGDEESSLLISINPSDGTEKVLQTINDLDIDSPVFDKTTNRIYTVSGNESEDIKLLTYNLSDNTYSTINLTSNSDNYHTYYELVVGKDGALYAFRSIYGISSNEEFSLLISIDPSDGTEKKLQTINDLDTDYPVFDKTINRIYTVCGIEGDDLKLLSYNLSDNTYSTVSLEGGNKNYIYYELVIAY